MNTLPNFSPATTLRHFFAWLLPSASRSFAPLDERIQAFMSEYRAATAEQCIRFLQDHGPS